MLTWETREAANTLMRQRLEIYRACLAAESMERPSPPGRDGGMAMGQLRRVGSAPADAQPVVPDAGKRRLTRSSSQPGLHSDCDTWRDEAIALEDKVTRWLRQTGQCVRQEKPPQVNKEAVVVDRIPGLFGFPMYQEMLAVCVFAVLVIVAALAVMLHLAGQLSTAENIPGELLMGGIHTSFPRSSLELQRAHKAPQPHPDPGQLPNRLRVLHRKWFRSLLQHAQ